MSRSKKLIDALQYEGKRWEQSQDKKEEELKNLMGNMIMSAGLIAYLGALDSDSRKKSLNSWLELLHESKFPVD